MRQIAGALAQLEKARLVSELKHARAPTAANPPRALFYDCVSGTTIRWGQDWRRWRGAPCFERVERRKSPSPAPPASLCIKWKDAKMDDGLPTGRSRLHQ